MANIKSKETLKYQWKKGDDFGKIVEFSRKDDKFTYFKDGSRLFTEVLPEFLEVFVDGKPPFPGAGIDNSPIVSNPVVSETKNETVIKKESISPLTTLIKTLSSKNVESFNLNVAINLPKKEIFNMLVENSEEETAEILKEISNTAVSQIEINNLQEFLKEQITEFVTNYYKL